jgi:hypothetical protein
MSPGDQLRTALIFVHLDQQHLDPLSGPIALVRHLLPGGHHRLGFPELDDDCPRVRALDDAIQHLALLVVEVFVDRVPLIVPNPLQDDLFHRLGGDAAEVFGGALNADLIPDSRAGRIGHRFSQRDLAQGVIDLIDHRLDGEDAHGAGGLVDIDGDFLLGIRHLLVDALQRMLDRGEHRLFGDPPLGGDLRDGRIEVALHARNAPFLGHVGWAARWRNGAPQRCDVGAPDGRS